MRRSRSGFSPAWAVSLASQNCALVTDDPNGSIGITVAGYDSGDHGVVEHFEFQGSQGSLVDQAGSWPMLHHDPRLTGDAQVPLSMH